MSSPSFQPYVKFYTWPMLTYPALYLSWLIVPLLPWLRWSNLREQGRRLAAIYLFGGIYLLWSSDRRRSGSSGGRCGSSRT